MKKYILSIMAVALAFAFSAFTTYSKQPAGDEPPLYWYFIDEEGKIGDPVAGNNLRTKTNVSSSVLCDDQQLPDCARGFSTLQVKGDEAPPATDPDDLDHIMESN